MEMFLMGLCLSLLGVAVSAGLFAAATRGEMQEERKRPELHVDDALPLSVPQFFAAGASGMPATRVPIEVLLLQVERHVRLEQAAAESFLNLPTAASLYSRTTSPLVH